MDHDPATESAAGPQRGYVICSEPRSGSTLLCEWLGSTGVFGRPREYFRTVGDSVAIEKNPGGLADVLEQAATPNGVYGMKLFSYHVDTTSKARWLGRLPGARFIHLERRDLLGQAISLVRAWQTQQYYSHQNAHGSLRYDRRAIQRHLMQLALANARWRTYFARNGLDVLWLVYEDIVRDPDATMRAIAAHVGIDEPAAIRPELIRVAVQRDAVSDEWRTRFLAETSDLDRLDHPLGRTRIGVRRLARDAGYWARRWTGRGNPVSPKGTVGGIPRTDHSNTG
jgi:LPS sulfotransferase NodH